MSKILATASGQWVEGNWNERKGWLINTSDILTELIHYAGRYCDNYASDILHVWNAINKEENLTNKKWHETIYIGFNEDGVDASSQPWDKGNKVYELYTENRYYYRKLLFLIVIASSNGMLEMQLEEVVL